MDRIIRVVLQKKNTTAYLNVMKHPAVKILGHCDNPHFPVDFETLAVAAREYGVIFEINEASLAPYGYRGDTRANNREILRCCRKYEIPVVLSSDSHGAEHIGDFTLRRGTDSRRNVPPDPSPE